eukprot:316105_1
MSVTVINNVAYIKSGRKPSNKQLGQALIINEKNIDNSLYYCTINKCTFWNDANITEDRSIEFLLSKNLSDKSITALVSGVIPSMSTILIPSMQDIKYQLHGMKTMVYMNQK